MLLPPPRAVLAKRLCEAKESGREGGGGGGGRGGEGEPLGLQSEIENSQQGLSQEGLKSEVALRGPSAAAPRSQIGARLSSRSNPLSANQGARSLARSTALRKRGRRRSLKNRQRNSPSLVALTRCFYVGPGLEVCPNLARRLFRLLLPPPPPPTQHTPPATRPLLFIPNANHS